MNEVQNRIAELENRGWSLAALADELGVTVNAVEKWKAGDSSPSNGKAILALFDVIAKKTDIPKKRRYEPGSRVRTSTVTRSEEMTLPDSMNISPIDEYHQIPDSQSIPMFVAQKWGFPLEHQEVDDVDFYCIKDWISGLTGVNDLRAKHMWWNYQERHKGDKPLLSRERLYHGKYGNGYPADFTTDEGLYKIAIGIRVSKERTVLKAIKDFLAKAGVFADEARRDPEAVAEKLATVRRTKALASGKSEDWVATRELSVITRKQFTTAIFNLVEDKHAFGLIIGGITNDVYRGVFDSDVKGLRARLGITTKQNPRDHFSIIALAYTTVAEESVKIYLSQYSDKEFVPVSVMRDVVNGIAAAVGVQSNTIAQALQIDVVSGRKISDGPLPTQGTLGAILKSASQKKLPPTNKVA